MRQGDIIDIALRDISFFQFPEFHKMRKLEPKADNGLTSGTWDTIKDIHFFWSARYEDGRHQKTGMVPLENYAFYTSLCAHFHNGLPWEETPWLQWIREKRPSRYKTEEAIQIRLTFLENLYQACISGNYNMSRDIELPLVNIGRGGRIAIEDGRHRICICKAAGVDHIPVKINAVMPAS
ncbi:MAG: hypothetical protein ACPGUX_00830 [Halocynthiibacter sp.]